MSAREMCSALGTMRTTMNSLRSRYYCLSRNNASMLLVYFRVHRHYSAEHYTRARGSEVFLFSLVPMAHTLIRFVGELLPYGSISIETIRKTISAHGKYLYYVSNARILSHTGLAGSTSGDRFLGS